MTTIHSGHRCWVQASAPAWHPPAAWRAPVLGRLPQPASALATGTTRPVRPSRCRGPSASRPRALTPDIPRSRRAPHHADAYCDIGRFGPGVEGHEVDISTAGGLGDQRVVGGATRYPCSRELVEEWQNRCGIKRLRWIRKGPAQNGDGEFRGNLATSRQPREDGVRLQQHMGDRRRLRREECSCRLVVLVPRAHAGDDDGCVGSRRIQGRCDSRRSRTWARESSATGSWGSITSIPSTSVASALSGSGSISSLPSLMRARSGWPGSMARPSRSAFGMTSRPD